MSETVKIVGLELENVKRVALVRFAPGPNGLTVIGGDNAQGKSSVLDGIIYALGGEKYRPTNLQREGSLAEAKIRIELSNGMIVERKGKNAALKVSDPSGRRSGQKLLDEFVEELALNIPKFVAMRDDEKAEVLLQTLGIGEQLRELDQREQIAYDRRHAFGVVVDQKVKYAAEMPEYHDVPETPLSAADMIKASQEILTRNQARQNARNQQAELERKYADLVAQIEAARKVIEHCNGELQPIESALAEAAAQPVSADESTAELEAKIADIDTINAKIRANADKAKAEADAEDFQHKKLEYDDAVEAIRQERRDLLNTASMPLAELTIGKNDKARPVLLYRGQPWDCMSGMERIRVAVSIVRKLKPECGFMLLDGLESFDLEQLKEFDAYLAEHGLQAIATRVSRGDECTIVIEDGMAVQPGVEVASGVDATPAKSNLGSW